MTGISAQMKSEAMEMQGHSPGVVLRSLVIGLTAFLTVVDLFATQAILPSLTRHYNITRPRWALRSTRAPWAWRSRGSWSAF